MWRPPPGSLCAQALVGDDAVLHLAPEALFPTLRLGLSPGSGADDEPLPGRRGGGAGPDTAGGTLGADGRPASPWLLRRLEGSRGWALQRRGEAAPVQTGAAVVEGGPRPAWLVLDGPLGCPSADALTALLMAGGGRGGAGGALGGGVGGAAHVLPGGEGVAAAPEGLHVVWEASSLAGASPALLAAVPVVHVPSGLGGGASGGLWEPDAQLATAVRGVLKQQGLVRRGKGLQPRHSREVAHAAGLGLLTGRGCGPCTACRPRS